jgi:cytochrome c
MRNAIVLGLMAAATPALAAEYPALSIEGDPAYGEYLATECVTCHNGKPSAGTAIPTIAGREPKEIIVALYEYKGKQRPNQTMQMVATALGDAEIAALAAYLSQLPKQSQ